MTPRSCLPLVARFSIGFLGVGVLSAVVQAQPATAAPEITLTMEQTSYRPFEPVVVRVTYRNPSDQWQPWIGPVPGGSGSPLWVYIQHQQPDGMWEPMWLYRRFMEHVPRSGVDIGPWGTMTTHLTLSDFYEASTRPGVYEVTMRHHPDEGNLAYARSNTVRYEVLPYETPGEAAVANFVRGFTEGQLAWRGGHRTMLYMSEYEIVPYVDSLVALTGLPRFAQAAMASHYAWFLSEFQRYGRSQEAGSDTLSTSALVTQEDWQAASRVAFDDVAARFPDTHYGEVAALASPFFVEHFVYEAMRVENPSAAECGGGTQVVRPVSHYARWQSDGQARAAVECIQP